MLEGQDPSHGDAIAMTEERSDADATTLSETSKDRDLEADHSIPEGPRETLEKAAHEADAGEGATDTAKRLGRELDRAVGGEYEAREDEAAAPREEQREER
jgi:hypothetical protein